MTKKEESKKEELKKVKKVSEPEFTPPTDPFPSPDDEIKQ
jgi:hypothetical protein